VTTLSDYFAATQFQGVNEGVTTPGVTTSLEGTPRDGTYSNLQGAQGDEGAQGDPGTPFVWQGDVSDRIALNSLIPTLDANRLGYVYRVLDDNSVMFWTGTRFVSFPDAFGGLGPEGSVNTISIGTVSTGAVGTPLIVSITGSPPSQTINLTVPQGGSGQKGIQGPPGPIANSTDWDNTVTLTNGMIPLWSTSTSKWTPTEWQGFRGPWTVMEAQSWDNPTAGFSADQTNVSTSPNTIATVNIPALPIRWRPYITGGCILSPVPTDFSTRVDLEVHIGSAGGDIVARGVGSAVYVDRFVRLTPFFASTFTAGSTVGTIAASTATTLYVIIKRNLGSGNYNYKRTTAQIAVWAQPAVAP